MMLASHDDPEMAAEFALSDLLTEIEAQTTETTDERAS